LRTNNPQRTGKIEHVELLGHGKVDFTRDSEALKIHLPPQKPCEHAYALKLSGIDLT
jgi:alpha-L-fucosidase